MEKRQRSSNEAQTSNHGGLRLKTEETRDISPLKSTHKIRTIHIWHKVSRTTCQHAILFPPKENLNNNESFRGRQNDIYRTHRTCGADVFLWT